MVYTVDIVYTVDMVYSVDTVDTVGMVYSVDTVDTVMTATNIAVIAHGPWEHTTLTCLDCCDYYSTRRANDKYEQ